MRKKSVKFKNFNVTIQEDQPTYQDKTGYALTINNGNNIFMKYDATDILTLVHEVMHSIQDQQHYDELMALCNYDEKLYLMLSEKIATIGENMAAILFVDEKKKTAKVFEKMEELAKELSITKKSDNSGTQSPKVRKKKNELQNSQDQNKNGFKKVGDELSKITQPIEQNHTKEESK